MSELLGEKEAALYDRQIRVWGVEAQQKMQSCKVLVCGLRGVHVEVIKNLVLAGVNVTIQDDSTVQECDLGSNYFVSPKDVGQHIAACSHAKVQNLNNFTAVVCEERALRDIEDEFFKQFDVILLSSDCDHFLKYKHFSCDKEALRINQICREQPTQISFYWSGTFSLEGWFIVDLGDCFEYKDDNPLSKLKQMRFPSLEDVLTKKWSEMKSKHFHLPKTFIQSRLLSAFKASKGRSPTIEGDLIDMQRIAASSLIENGLPSDFLNDKLVSLCKASSAALIMVSLTLLSPSLFFFLYLFFLSFYLFLFLSLSIFFSLSIYIYIYPFLSVSFS